MSVERNPVVGWHALIKGLHDLQAKRADGRHLAEIDRPRTSALQDQTQDVNRRYGRVRYANLKRNSRQQPH